MRKIISGLYIVTALTACAGNDLLVQRQTSLEGRLEQVMQGHNSGKSDLAEVSASIVSQKELVARQAAAIKELQASHDALQEKVRILVRRLEQLEAPPRQNSPIELVNQENVTEGREESVQAAYMKAFGLFSANSYGAAADAFSDFISSYPESEYAANARFWLGECYYSEGRYNEAIEAFTRVLEMKPAEKRAADSILKIGLSQYAINNPAKGASTLKLLLEKYPLSEAATKAKEQLGRSKE
ncbi:MAG: tol-pal system protein YbgF [Geobacter sp.]|nr:tol-pal system protein YbgF [Geobacter sp.]